MTLKDDYYTITELAYICCVSRQTVSRWIKGNKFPIEKNGRESLIDKGLFADFCRIRRDELRERASEWNMLAKYME